MPKIKIGTRLTYDDLRDVIHAILEADDRSYAGLTETLGCTRSAISGAANQSGPHVFKLQVRLLELLTPYTLDEPTFRVIRKPKQ